MSIFLNGVSDEGGPASLGDIPGINLTGLATNDGIMWDGAEWIPQGFVRRSGDTMTGELVANGGVEIGASAELQFTGAPGYAIRKHPSFGLIEHVGGVTMSSGTYLQAFGGSVLRGRAGIGGSDEVALNNDFLAFGPGGAGSLDTILRRAGANTLRFDAGDTLQIQQDPVLDNDLARKKYVDDTLGGTGFVVDTGDTMTGALEFNTDNVGDGNPILRSIKTATGFKAFTIDSLGTMTWSDSVTGNSQQSIQRLGSTNLQLSAGHQFSVQQDPVGAGDLSRKEYVDVRDRHARQLYVSVAGTAAIDGYRTVVVNVTGMVTAQLPAFPLPGHHVTIKRMSASGGGNLVTIDGNGKNIDDTATKTLNSQYSALTVEYNSNMNQWVIL